MAKESYSDLKKEKTKLEEKMKVLMLHKDEMMIVNHHTIEESAVS